MATKNVDIVFLVDASESMLPCLQKVCDNISTLVDSLNQLSFNIHLGLLAHCMPNYHVYQFDGLSNGVIDIIYRNDDGQNTARNKLFTDDVEIFCRKLSILTPMGDEDTLCALDTACDFPFGPLQTTQRIIVMLTDETFETGLPGEASIKKIPDIIEKIHARNITLFAALPDGPAAAELSCANRADFVTLENAEDGLRDFDFQDFFKQLGRTISTRVTQMTSEPPYKKGLFGQAQWGVSYDHTVIGEQGGRR